MTTPLNVNGQLLLSTEKNGTRLYAFDDHGQIRSVPAAWNPGFTPDTATPVAIGDMLFGCSGRLFCLDLNDGLRTLYRIEDDSAFKSHATFLGGNGHVLAVSVEGELVLLKASREHTTPVSRLRLFRDTEVWSHPALVGNRLYIRTMTEVCCILLSGTTGD